MVPMLSDSELIALMQGGESDRVEFTESVKDPDKIRDAVCAFANDMPGHKKPGIMFIGVKDDGSCAGLHIDDDLLKKLSNLRSDGKIQPIPVMQVDKRQLGGCEVAVIQVEPSENPPIKVRGRCWIRVGPSRAQASAEDENQLTNKRLGKALPYDMSGVEDASVEADLDMARFGDEYLPSAVSPEVIKENRRDVIEQMRALRLMTLGGLPTVTAILMLGQSPQFWFPGAEVQFVRFDGSEVTDPIKSEAVITGTLPDQLRELDRILQANISTALDTSGERHIELPDYPYEALRELVRNAVIHRNYDRSYAPVQVHWFADKIVISSPGGLWGDVTPENFETGTVPSRRNPTIAEAMKGMGFMQKFGIGIQTAKKALRDNGNPPAEFHPEDNFFIVTVKCK